MKDGSWHQAAMVGNINTQSLYINGEIIGTRIGTLNQTWWVYSFIGTRYDSTSRNFPFTGWHYFNGSIDEIRIYNRALSDTEIKALYDGTK